MMYNDMRGKQMPESVKFSCMIFFVISAIASVGLMLSSSQKMMTQHRQVESKKEKETAEWLKILPKE